jgi:hypothetical protein
MAGGKVATIPLGEHIRAHYLILVKDIGQAPGKLKPFEIPIFTGKVRYERLVVRTLEVPKQLIQPPGKNRPLETVGAYSHPQPVGNKAQKIKRQKKFKITKRTERIGQALADHSLHSLALDEKELRGKKVRLFVRPDNLGHMTEQIFGPVGDVEVEHKIYTSPKSRYSR